MKVEEGLARLFPQKSGFTQIVRVFRADTSIVCISVSIFAW